MKKIRSPEKFLYTLKERSHKKEDGFNGVNYVFYLMIVLTIWVVFACATFLDGARVAENNCDINLHEIESGILAMNGSTDIIGTELGSELKRAHIIPAVDGTTNSRTADETTQVRAIGYYIEAEFKKRFCLEGSKPTAGILKTACGADSDVNLTRVVIYEPVMDITVVAPDGTTIGTFQPAIYEHIIQAWQSGNSEDVQQWIPTTTTDFHYDPSVLPSVEYGPITRWVIYTIRFNENNNYAGYTKQRVSVANTPTLKRDPSFGLAGNTTKKAEGATIEMTMAITIRGVNQVFADSTVGANSGIFDHIDPMYKDTPTRTDHSITITQAADIVPAETDKRKR